MKILWFTNTPSCYKGLKTAYNGGGWISSLEEECKKRENLDLGISFLLDDEPFKIEQDKVTYYPISNQKSNKLFSIIKLFSQYKIEEDMPIIKRMIDIVNDFQPDIIHIFGSEKQFGLISLYTQIPIILHIQGILIPYLNAFLPPFISWYTMYSNQFSFKGKLKIWINKRRWERNVQREKIILKSVTNYIGRTSWDNRVIKVINSDAKYYYGGEILREEFYVTSIRNLPSSLVIVSTISNPMYKGYDMILKTAFILKHELKLEFKWLVFGNLSPSFIENIVHIKHQDVNVGLMGIADAKDLKNALLNCSVFVHPSYIDNSPNSLCEAQILGCPVIATNVGGIPSLIEEGKTGFCIPANDPYQAAYLIQLLNANKKLNLNIGLQAKEVAMKRHNKQVIVNELIKIYSKL